MNYRIMTDGTERYKIEKFDSDSWKNVQTCDHGIYVTKYFPTFDLAKMYLEQLILSDKRFNNPKWEQVWP